MSRTIEGRLAKLEARGGIGKGEVIFVQNRPDESKEEFDRRVEAVVREAKQRTKGPVFALKVTVAARESGLAAGQ